VIRFAYNVFSKYSPEWGFVPALILALIIFKSRMRTFLRFMQTVYLDKRDRVRAWLSGPRLWGAAVVALLVFVLPLFHETVTARFLLEPVRLATVRTTVPGRVMEVMVREGESVRAGESLLRMDNANLESARAGSGEQFTLTGAQDVQAQLNQRGLGAALQQHTRAGVEETVANEESDQLVARAPIDGVVMTPRLRDLLGSTLDAGTLITGIADLHAMRARIFIPEYAVGRVRAGARVRLLADGSFAARTGDVAGIQPAAGDLPPAVESIKEIKGGAKLEYYIADAIIANDGSLQSGMTGTAKIVVRRASLAQMTAKVLQDFVDRKVW
jgi:multidrug resistance efflux pump